MAVAEATAASDITRAAVTVQAVEITVVVTTQGVITPAAQEAVTVQTTIIVRPITTVLQVTDPQVTTESRTTMVHIINRHLITTTHITGHITAATTGRVYITTILTTDPIIIRITT